MFENEGVFLYEECCEVEFSSSIELSSSCGSILFGVSVERVVGISPRDSTQHRISLSTAQLLVNRLSKKKLIRQHE
jgi:hypothetical protein